MDLTNLPFVSTLLNLTYSGLMALIALLTPAAGELSAAFAIVLVTLIVRAALIPTGIAQAKADQVRARLAPRLRDLKKRHRADPERLQRETMQLYRSEGASPLNGCLPILVQAPVVGLLYAVFLHTSLAGHLNDLLTQTLFGVPLGTSLAGAVASGAAGLSTWIVIGSVVLMIAAIGEVTRRKFRATPLDTADEPRSSRLPARLLGLLQFATAVAAIFVPLAAGLYLLTTASWTLGQRLILRRIYPQAS